MTLRLSFLVLLLAAVPALAQTPAPKPSAAEQAGDMLLNQCTVTQKLIATQAIQLQMDNKTLQDQVTALTKENEALKAKVAIPHP